jgi:hypothetical protein
VSGISIAAGKIISLRQCVAPAPQGWKKLRLGNLPGKSIFGHSKGDAAISSIGLHVKGRAFVNR